MGVTMKKSIRTMIGTTAGLALALSVMQPAAASERPDSAPATPTVTTQQGAPNTPAYRSWVGDEQVLSIPVVDKGLKITAASGGKRMLHTRGTALLWTRNVFEWRWANSLMSSSTGWQETGYIFPNTAREGGIQRTNKGAKSHSWRGTNIAGAGVVTPWGDVNVYRNTLTDYYVLRVGGTYTVN